MASREEEEISELQEDDREQFSDQLASIGMLGRIAAEHCIPLLIRYSLSHVYPLIWSLLFSFIASSLWEKIINLFNVSLQFVRRQSDKASWPVTKASAINKFSWIKLH